MKLFLCTIFFSLTLMSCVKKTLLEDSSFKGKVIMSINWDLLPIEDDSIFLRTEGNVVVVHRNENPEMLVLDAGTYKLTTYNKEVVGDRIYLNSIPDKIFYSTTKNISLVEGETINVDITPICRVRELNIKFNKDSISHMKWLEGTLNNVADILDIEANKIGNATDLHFEFVEGSAKLNLFGLIGDSQEIKINYVMNFDTTITEQIYNVSTLLNGFNSDMQTPKIITVGY